MTHATLALALAAVACAHASRRPAATREADGSESPGIGRHVSAPAYRHYLEALLARNDDDLTRAESELRVALQYDPDSAHLHAILAELLLRQGRLEGGEEELRAALALDAKHAPALLVAARLALTQERADAGRADLRAAIDADPSLAEAHRELVRAELSAGDAQAARAAAEALSARSVAAQQQADDEDELSRGAHSWEAQRLRDHAAGAWVEVARFLARRGDDAGAQDAFGRARQASPSDPEALAAEAAFLESRRKYPEARELQLRMLARRPDAPEVISALARLALEEGDLEIAGAHARKLIALAAEMEPAGAAGSEEDRRDLAGALLRVAVPLLGARRSAEAQTALDAALRLYPAHVEIAFYRALALVQRGRPRDGAQAFEQIERKLLTGDPDAPAFLGIEPRALLLDVRVHGALARGRAGEQAESCRRLRALFDVHPLEESVPTALVEACERAGRVAEAENILAAAVRAHPEEEALLYALATAQDRTGHRDRAVSTMRRVLALNPANAQALNFVGYTLVEQGGADRVREAEGLLQRAVALRPEDGSIADSYGFCLLRLGRGEEALAELRRADRLSPGDPVILGHLGDALLARGRRNEALDAFRRALSLLLPRGPRPVQRAAATVDPLDRLPDPSDARVRAELERKVRALVP